MQLSDVKRWQEAEAVNTGPYGRAVVTFARAWAEAMERRLAALPSPFVEHAVELVAEPAMDDARRLRPPSEGLTGFQFGCVIDLLAAAWPRGKELQRWHNACMAPPDEANRASDAGATINPALLTVDVRPRHRLRWWKR